MRCDVHCPKPDGLSVLAALVVLGIAALAGWAMEAVSVWAGIAAVVFAVDAAGCVVAYRLARYRSLRKPANIPSPPAANIRALPGAPLALPAARPVVHVITDAREVAREHT